MSSRILLVANDLVLDEAAPMSGGALRAWGVAEGLRGKGFEVITSIPQPGITRMATRMWDQVPPALRETSWNWENQDALVAQVNPDVIVYSSNPIHLALRQRPRQPLVLDLHGPVMLEDHYIHGQTTALDFDLWRRKLHWGDFFLTPGHKQKRFFWSWFLRAGIDLESGRVLQVMPVSLSPQLPQREPRGQREPVFVFGGGFFPWTDPSDALLEVVDRLERADHGELWAFTDAHQLRASQDRFAEISRRMLASPRVRFPGFLPRGELLKTYARADVAVDPMRWNPERELAFTTRTIEYLWCGLPVIYNDYAELAPLIERYRAGWCIDPDDRAALVRVLDTILNEPELVAEYGRNAQRLAAEQFSWDRTIEPLARFCRQPVRRQLTPRGSEEPATVETRSDKVTPEIVGGGRLTARWVCQEDSLSSVEIKLATYCRKNSGEVHVSLTHPASGIELARRTVDAGQIEDNSWLLIELEPPLRNAAERVLELSIWAPDCRAGNAISAWACHAAAFPFLSLDYDGQPLGGALCLKTFHRAGAEDGLELPETEEPRGADPWVVIDDEPVPLSAGPVAGAMDYFLADWNGDGTADLWVVKRRGTDTGRTEVHIFCGRSRFQKPLLQIVTPLDETGPEYAFSVVDWNRDGVPDLVAVKKAHTESGQTEVHVFCGRSRFQKPLLQATTCLPADDFAAAPAWAAAGPGPAGIVAISAGEAPRARLIQRIDGSHPAGPPADWRRMLGRAQHELVSRVKSSPAGPALRRIKRRLGL